MTKTRLEALSDGIFAIVLTLLVLDFRVPEEASTLGADLMGLLPNLAAWALSFVTVALYWLAHHRIFHAVKSVDGPFVWLNFAWLMLVCLIPVPASLIGRHPGEPWAAAVYGLNLMLINLLGFCASFYLVKNPGLCVKAVTLRQFKEQWPVYGVVNGAYLLGVAMSRWMPRSALLLYAIVLVCLVWLYSQPTSVFLEAGKARAKGARR